MSINLFLIGRVLIGIYFLLPGIAKVFLFSANLDVVITKEVPLPVFSLSIVAAAQITRIIYYFWKTFKNKLYWLSNNYLTHKLLYS